MVTVGIPAALSYYRYFPLWKTLLEGLGAEVVVSRETSEALLENGVRYCVDDICVPVKLYYGHVLDIKDAIDYLFVQRLVSVEKSKMDSFTCPKLMGLPDMIKGSIDDLPPLMEFRLDINRYPLKKTARMLAAPLAPSASKLRAALKRAVAVQKLFEEQLLTGADPASSMRRVLKNGKGNGEHRREWPRGNKPKDLNIALVGHEYLIHDRFISHDLPRKLERQGANVFYMTQVPPSVIDREIGRYPEISWSYEKFLLGAASHFLRREDVHGVMIVMGFACGPDSIVSEIITREVRTEDSPPVMTLVLDEHTGEAGVTTRVEAFVDLVRRSRRK
jgi:predicted nucleotide-binding protein (sugar kinase/HSP70/actin superfamily)